MHKNFLLCAVLWTKQNNRLKYKKSLKKIYSLQIIMKKKTWKGNTKNVNKIKKYSFKKKPKKSTCTTGTFNIFFFRTVLFTGLHDSLLFSVCLFCEKRPRTSTGDNPKITFLLEAYFSAFKTRFSCHLVFFEISAPSHLKLSIPFEVKRWSFFLYINQIVFR